MGIWRILGIQMRFQILAICYNVFKMCIIEPPSVIYSEDVVMNFKQCTDLERDIELTGILEYFLDMWNKTLNHDKNVFEYWFWEYQLCSRNLLEM